jgi:FAD/FMN-containing dehydrogenase
MVMSSANQKGLPISQLRDSIKGRLITPDSAEYDEARTIFYGGFDRRPSVIVRAASSDDVIRVVSLAAETGVELAIRSGGHSVAGHSVSDGIVLDLSEMKDLQIDSESRTAWAQPGLTAGEYTFQAEAHGLATPFGDTGAVGIGGITLAGGIGLLVRKYGLTIDALHAADIVTADGQILAVDSETHPDLFWAIRGGGGNFGVVTRLRYRLYELPPIVGGMLFLPANADTIDSFIAEAQAAPDGLSTIANVMAAPPMPFLPEEHHGQLVIMAVFTFAGPVEEGERLIARFRALGPPIADMVRPAPYSEILLPVEEGYHPIAAARTMFVDSLSEAGKTVLEQLRASTAPMRVAQLRVLGGAMARVPDDATAFAHRRRPFMVNVAAVYENRDEAASHWEWVDRFAAEMRKGEDGAYSGFLGDEGEDRVRQAYPGATWDRLTAIKSRYDPNNLFRLNQNIPPSGQ